jgi:poly-gamma-glutamate capsule biosynthesis protein CapA/YwtB (metallophosphatase superfamily)
MDNKSGDVLIYGVGDIAPLRENPGSIFEKVAPVIKRSDIAFCQLEINLSSKGSPLPQARLAMQADRETARAIKNAGFNIVSFASNHCMDWGIESFMDTIDALKEQGLYVIGAGRNIDEARKPAIIEIRGNRVAFLAYNTILPYGYWAESDRPGCAPMRALTLYEQIEHDQPGTPCKTHTFAHRDDLSAMIWDIQAARQKADVVILSMHWGIHFIPAVIAEYQREIGHTAIDNGADLILGHHAHILKGTEVYKGKAIFYSMCNFALDLAPTKEMLERPRHQEIEKLNPAWKPDPEYPTYYMPPDSRKTLMTKCVVSDRRVREVSFMPTYINKASQPEVLTAGEERFSQVVNYMTQITRDQDLPVTYVVHGNEVLLRQMGNI